MFDLNQYFNLINWWPWLNLLSDSFLVQFLLIYTLYIFYISKNIFYSVFYFFLAILFFGLVLCLYQVELFVGFLWLVECVVVFALFLLLFFFKTTGTWSNLFSHVYYYIYGGISLIILCIIYYSVSISFLENTACILLNFTDFWDNYYEALKNSNINDFTGFLISYYTYNSLELIIMGFLILIASLICVNLNKIVQKTRIQNTDDFLKIFNFFKNFVNFIFMRQQNLTNQAAQIPTSRIFKKKLNK